MNKSLAEQLGENFDTLSEGVTTEPVEIGHEPEQEPVQEPKDERPRDESGRFAKDERKTLTLKEVKRDPKTGGHVAEKESPEGEASAVEAKAAVEKPVEKETIPAPVDWSGGAKVKWDRLPHEVKQELARSYETVSQAKSLLPVIQPYMDRFTMDFGGAPQALNAILGTWKYAKTQPLDFVREFIQTTGIDPRSLGGQQTQEAQAEMQGDPVLTALQQKIAGLEGQLSQLAEMPVQAQNAQIDTEIQAFRADPAHPYFNDVRPVMAALMQAGTARTLKEAYDMACYANPGIRAQIEAQKAQALQEQRRQATVRSANAAVSVNGAPGVSRPSTPQHQSVTDAITARYEEMIGRA